MSAATGTDIESLCSKCGDVWHVVVAKVGDAIAKVQCKECGAFHRYRDPNGKKSSGTPVRRRSTANGSGKTAAVTAPTGPVCEPDLSKPIRAYSLRDRYDVGERVDHPKFGIGIVENTATPGKMDVFFPIGRKVLATAKANNGLMRPTTSFDD